MNAVIDIMGKPVRVEWSAAADSKLQALAEPLQVEMELYFSCLLRKKVRFGVDAQAKNFVEVAPKLRVGFRPVMTRTCLATDFEGEPPVEDFPIVKPEAFVPKRLKIDFVGEKWSGEFFL